MLINMKKIISIKKKIAKLLAQMAELGPMRPGSISKQYRDRENRRGAYYQLSYTHKMRSRTEHVWPEHVKALRKEVAEHKRFRKMSQDLVDLSIELSKEKIARLRDQADD